MADDSVSFTEIVAKLLRNWDVLRHAVEAHFGGIHSIEKAEWLELVVVQFFNENDDLKPTEVVHFVSEIMDNEFNLIVEDVSLLNLSKNMCKCFAWSKNGEQSSLREFFSQIKTISTEEIKSKIQIQSNEEDDDSSSEEQQNDDEPMEIDTPKMENEDNVAVANSSEVQPEKMVSKSENLDEDGWTIVTHKKK